MGGLSKNIQLMLAFLREHFLVSYFSYDMLISFFIMLFLTFLSRLMIQLLFFKREEASGLRQQAKIVFNFEPGLRDYELELEMT